MTEIEPAESHDGRIVVRELRDDGSNSRVPCSSYEAAISEVKQRVGSDTVVKIESRDGDVVFSSATMDIEAWEVEWEREIRRLSVDVERRDCPHDNRNCFTDDRCVQCQIDEVQSTW